MLSAFTFLALTAGGLFTSPVQAQAVDDSWSDPENLSHSGSSTDPQIVIDSKGAIYVGWQDSISGPRYTKMDEAGWSEPAGINSLLNMPTTVMITDTTGRIHAVWIDPVSENLNLFHSYTWENNFPDGWTPAIMVAQWVQDFDVVLGEDGSLHLAYVRSEDAIDSPAGIYYRRFSGNSRTWLGRELLYQSSYLRMITEENASIEIETQMAGEAQQVYVVWDNSLRNDVYFTKSANNGEDWGEPLKIQASEKEIDRGKQFGLQIAVSAEDLLLLWQEEATSTTCRQFSLVSSDYGESWRTKQRMLPDFLGCPTNNQLVAANDLIILDTTLLNQMHIMAWNGSNWSEPQLQHSLMNLTDSETGDPVNLQCRQLTAYNNDLIMVGCDAGIGGDIWLSRLSLDAKEKWFSPNLYWSYPTALAENIVGINDVSLAADPQGSYHAVWSQYKQDPSSGTLSAIHYASVDGQSWSESQAVIGALPGKVKNLMPFIDKQGRLLLFWIGGSSRQVYFSKANARTARNKAEWFEPIQLPAPSHGVDSLDVFIAEDGTLFAAYTIPLNEHRGVYLTQSVDQGNTWAEPTLVFGAVKAGWDMVSRPQLTGTGSNSLHMLWTQYTLPGGDGPIGLYYSRSSDNGKTWSEAQETAKASVQWSEIISVDNQVIHRIWEEKSNNRPTLWFEISRDNGLTWQQLNNISNLGMSNGISKLVRDANGSLHLLELVKETHGVMGNVFLQEWFWKGEGWTAGDSVNLGSGNIESSLLAADVTSIGKLSSLVYLLRENDENTSSGEILITGYELERAEQTSMLPGKLNSWISSFLFFAAQ